MDLYLEGGQKLRGSMAQFIRRAVGPVDIKIHPCGSGDEAVRRCARDAGSLLLIDSEGVITQRWVDGIAARIGGADRAFFMVQLMEAWFLADRPALAAYYGPDFNPGSLPANPNPEDIPKADVEAGLRNATRRCAKGRYHKGNHPPELLLLIDPDRVRRSCPNFARLVGFLRGGGGGG